MHITKDRKLAYVPHSGANGQYYLIMHNEEVFVDLKVDNADAGQKLVDSLRTSGLISDSEAESLRDQARSLSPTGPEARHF